MTVITCVAARRRMETRIAYPDENVLWFGGDPVKGIPFGQVPDNYRAAKE